MSSDDQVARTERSPQSLRLEAIVRGTSFAGVLPNLSEILDGKLSDLEPMTAVVCPDAAARTLALTRVGSGLSAVQGQLEMGHDYLDLVDPAYKGEAFDSVFLMLSRPCGLWQLTPTYFTDGSRGIVEMTGFPLFDEPNGRGVVLFLINFDMKKLPRIRVVGTASEWEWLDIRGRNGGP